MMANHHDSPSPSPPRTAAGRRMKTCARRCERVCCAVATYFPLSFVYGLTTWAVWVDARIGFQPYKPGDTPEYAQKIPSIVGIILYLLLNASYTTAVFKEPGSPTEKKAGRGRGRYSELPTSEPMNELDDVQTITVSSTGGSRYCKKCHVQKPDRAHHCSTCKRCVLKMDHHCPWLATCLGLHNYKAFVLFLIYTTLFCWACFFNSAVWVWRGIFDDQKYLEQFAPVNNIMLAVLSGIIGLVLTGFTSWHLYLCARGMTTIECLEKTRYLSGVRKVVEQNRQERNSHSRETSDGIAGNLKRARDQILEFHANAVPGASRFEEGEERTSPTPSVDHNFQSFNQALPQHHSHASEGTFLYSSDSPAQRALRTNYSDYERSRESARYEEYVDDKETSSLPNAFDLGWRKNLSHLFGPNPWIWWLPICNTTGDGWRWEVSRQWRAAQEDLARRKEERLRSLATQPSHHQYQQQQHDYQSHLRGGGSHSNHIDRATTRRYAESAVSMQILQSQGIRSQKMRRDFDATGEDGEVAGFEVSGSEEDDNSGSSSEVDEDEEGDIFSRRQRLREQQQQNRNNGPPRSHNDSGTWGSRW